MVCFLGQKCQLASLAGFIRLVVTMFLGVLELPNLQVRTQGQDILNIGPPSWSEEYFFVDCRECSDVGIKLGWIY